MKHISMKRLYQWAIEYLSILGKEVIEEGGDEKQVKILMEEINKYLQFVWNKAKEKK